MLSYNVVLLAKNHNYFTSMDGYMKELARITLTLPNSQLRERLESVLSKEVVISTGSDNSAITATDLPYKTSNPAVHHNVLAKADFQFMSRALKQEEIKTNISLEKELEKVKQLQALLQTTAKGQSSELETRLLGSAVEFFRFVQEVDSSSYPKASEMLQDTASFSLFERLKKTSLALNEEA
jgi:hypothetical protein